MKRDLEAHQNWIHILFLESLMPDFFCFFSAVLSDTLWGTSSFALFWPDPDFAVISVNSTLSCPCLDPTWEHCITTARWSAQVHTEIHHTDTKPFKPLGSVQWKNVPRFPHVFINPYDFFRSMANAETEEVWIPTAAYVQGPHWPTTDLPLHAQQETR